jgi:hypothetical protein
MPQSDWYHTDESCDMCGARIYTKTTTTPTGQSTRSVRNVSYTRCLNGDCPKGRLPQ